MSIVGLQNDDAKNYLRRFASALTLHTTTNNNNGDRKGKGPTCTPSFKISNSNNISFSSNGSNRFYDSKKWSKSKDGSSTSKGFTKLVDIDKISKRKVSFTDKPFESWNKAKSKLTKDEYTKRLITKDEYNKLRISNACIICGEVEHKLSECNKPKL